MAHYALLDDTGKIIDVHVIADADCLDENGNESEEVGIDFCIKVAPHLKTTRGHWRKTSYNSFGGKRCDPTTGEQTEEEGFRKNYAAIGGVYDEKLDAFIPPKRFISWTLDEETCQWVSPIPYPPTVLDGVDPGGESDYEWDEALYQEDRTKGWVLIE